MATDNFTNTNGTALFTHNSDWGNYNSDTNEPEIQDNHCRPASAFQESYIRHTVSTEDRSDAIFIGNATLNRFRYLSLRTTATTLGYECRHSGISGTDYTGITIFRLGVFASSGSYTIDGTADQDVEFVGTVDGGNFDLEVFVGGVSRDTYTDTSPLSAGNPGFRLNGGGTAITADIDDWTDGVTAGTTILPFMMQY